VTDKFSLSTGLRARIERGCEKSGEYPNHVNVTPVEIARTLGIDAEHPVGNIPGDNGHRDEREVITVLGVPAGRRFGPHITAQPVSVLNNDPDCCITVDCAFGENGSCRTRTARVMMRRSQLLWWTFHQLEVAASGGVQRPDVLPQ
jgi:hypothetical protein